jgi:hypothetical protein
MFDVGWTFRMGLDKYEVLSKELTKPVFTPPGVMGISWRCELRNELTGMKTFWVLWESANPLRGPEILGIQEDPQWGERVAWGERGERVAWAETRDRKRFRRAAHAWFHREPS